MFLQTKLGERFFLRRWVDVCSSRVFWDFSFFSSVEQLVFVSPFFFIDYRRGRCCCCCLDVGQPECLHHLIGGVGACGVTLSADNLASGDHAELSSQVVFGLGGSGVDVLVGLTVTEEGHDELLIFIQKVTVLGLQLADEGLSAAVHVHGADEGEEAFGGGVGGIDIGLTPSALEFGGSIGRSRCPIRWFRRSVRRSRSSVGSLGSGISGSGVEGAVLVTASDGQLEEDGSGSELDSSDDGDDGSEGAGGGGDQGESKKGRHDDF